MSNPLKNRTVIYDKLHRLGIIAILGVSFVTMGLLGYNIYLFKTGKYLKIYNLVTLFKQIEFITYKYQILINLLTFFLLDGVPMLLNKYRAKIEEQIDIKQREAEYLEV